MLVAFVKPREYGVSLFALVMQIAARQYMFLIAVFLKATLNGQTNPLLNSYLTTF